MQPNRYIVILLLVFSFCQIASFCHAQLGLGQQARSKRSSITGLLLLHPPHVDPRRCATYARIMEGAPTGARAHRALAERTATRRPVSPRERIPASEWAGWDDEKLLDLRLCDLDLRIEGSGLEERIDELNGELEARGIRFRPRFWLSDEWFCPDGVPGIAIPFYLAHPRLARLEMAQMREVEGGTREWCLKILRHETGHAIENAYRLRQRPKRQQLFGKSSVQYPEHYTPRPYSRSFVVHLEAWYAQSHPDEDFAETFAVWLTPNSDWKRRYQGWPALRKLEYVDELLGDIAGTRPRNRLRRKIETLPEIRITLREHYDRRREKYAFEWPAYLDNDLRRIFSAEPRRRTRETAAAFLRRVAPEIQQLVSEGTGVHGYAIDHVLELMIARAGQLKLRVVGREEVLKRHLMIMLTVQTMNVVHSGYYRIAL